MANCNDFRTFKKEKDRICDFFENNVELCPLKIYHSGWNCLECDECCLVRIDFAIKTVQEWSNEHQIKTRQSEFLKVFPNTVFAPFSGVKVLNLCPKDLDCEFSCNAPYKSCLNCKIEYWLSETE